MTARDIEKEAMRDLSFALVLAFVGSFMIGCLL